MFKNFEFLHPQFFWLLLILPVLVLWYFWKRKKQLPSLRLSDTRSFLVVKSKLPKLKPLLFALRLAALVLLITALARPRNVAVSSHTKTTKGVDIVMAIDVSASMLAKDFKPNRLEALKKVATRFVEGRIGDRVGVVIYSGESFTQTPITSDKRVVINTIRKIRYGQLEGGTAIGMGLGSAVNRLKNSKAKSKVIILLTDGVNNTGFIDPKTASELAKEYGIKVYTIGIGTNGMAPFPVAKDFSGEFIYQNEPVEIDEELLRYIAKETDGKYFRATDNRKLKAIYKEIDALEKTEIEEFKYYNYQEIFRYFVLTAGMLILLELLLRFTIFRSFI